MKHFSTLQIKLLNALSDGLCHSGNRLGETLQVSRTAIWKQIKQLIDAGIPIQRLPRQGYRLHVPIHLLNEQAIRQHVDVSDFNKPLHFHLFASIDSTNQLLKELPLSNAAIDVCCSEQQTAGRGRFGRHWFSPFGENIYCSSRWHFDGDLSHLSGLSLVVSLAILATLKEVGIQESIQVKWPNDVLWCHKKLCGSLIEVIAESNGSAAIIIGIGLNVNSITNEHPLPDKDWCSLHDITGNYFDRNTLIAILMKQLHVLLNAFMLQGFSTFMERWNEIDYLQGHIITVSQPTGSLSGYAKGVDERGQLVLVDERGVTHYLSSGNTSLRV